MTLTPFQADALTELVNIGVGRAAGILNDMLNSRVQLSVPSVSLLHIDELDEEDDFFSQDKLSAVRMSFDGGITGVSAVVFPPESSAKLVSLLINDEDDHEELDSLRISTINEIGNIIINSVMASFGDTIGKMLRFTAPVYVEKSIHNLLSNDVAFEESAVILAQAKFTIDEYTIEGNIVLLFEIASLNSLLTTLTDGQ